MNTWRPMAMVTIVLSPLSLLSGLIAGQFIVTGFLAIAIAIIFIWFNELPKNDHIDIERHKVWTFYYLNEAGYATLQVGPFLFGWKTSEVNHVPMRSTEKA